MAKQAGSIFIEGTLDDLTFYKMDGVYYVRLKSSLTGKKFWKHEAFERSRQSCKRFGEGNQLASRLYNMIEKDKRQYKLFCFLKRRAILLLKEGNDLFGAAQLLLDYLQEFGFIEPKKDEGKNQENKACFNCNFLKANKPAQIHTPVPKLYADRGDDLLRPVPWGHQKSLEFEFPPGP